MKGRDVGRTVVLAVAVELVELLLLLVVELDDDALVIDGFQVCACVIVTSSK